jgi:NADPH:quinone reductase-like Zn-dependent oxidoreductase
MKALVQRVYGPPETLTFEDLPDPVPAAGEVLVRVRATSVNPYDWHYLRGEPYLARLMPGGFGPRRPEVGVLGCDMAGRVETAGATFRPGDDVYALLPRGGHAEYVCVPEDLLAPMPANLSYEQAAVMPMAAVTAMLALRGVEAGQRVVVNGASGGVGTFAVQLAKALGAQVDAVCGAGADLVRSLGADHVVDYREADFTRGGRRYDIVLDIAGGRSLVACRRILKRDGVFVAVGGPAGRWLQPAGHVFAALATGPFVRRRTVLADAVACRDKKEVLGELAARAESGALTPVIDRTYPFDDLRAAFAYQEAGHTKGKVVVTL